MKQVRIITDGACLGNPGRGGWAAILRHGGHTKDLYGCSPYTTNNRMELAGAIEGLRALKETCDVEMVTDSEYVLKGITQWIVGWKRKGWRTAGKKAVMNQDLWMVLDRLVSAHEVRWTWTRGHASDVDNNRADELATAAAAAQNFSKGYQPDVQFPSYELREAEPESVPPLL
jgi:ribonuclease HI